MLVRETFSPHLSPAWCSTSCCRSKLQNPSGGATSKPLSRHASAVDLEEFWRRKLHPSAVVAFLAVQTHSNTAGPPALESFPKLTVQPKQLLSAAHERTLLDCQQCWSREGGDPRGLGVCRPPVNPLSSAALQGVPGETRQAGKHPIPQMPDQNETDIRLISAGEVSPVQEERGKINKTKKKSLASLHATWAC